MRCVCVCVCVPVPLVSYKLLKTKCWYVERKCKSTICRFLIIQIVKKWLVFCDVLDLLTYAARWRQSRFLQRLSSLQQTDFNFIVSSVPRAWRWHSGYLDICQSLAYYDVHATRWRCGLTCPCARCITSSVYTLWNHNLIGVYSACLLVCSYRNVHSCIVTSLFQQLVKFECKLLIVVIMIL